MRLQTVKMSIVAAIALAGVLMAGHWWVPSPALADSVDKASLNSTKACLVLNITSGEDDLHAVTMALQLAGHGLDDGRQVVLFMNVRAPRLVSKQFSSEIAFQKNPPLKSMISKLIERGANLLVCPHCMHAQGVTEADLMPGAEVASRETLFGALGPNTAVFSY